MSELQLYVGASVDVKTEYNVFANDQAIRNPSPGPAYPVP